MTVIQFLETLPPGYRERALKNAKNNLNEPVDSLAIAIDLAFWWFHTDETHTFWNQVQNWAYDPRENQLPPLPPP